MENNLFLSVIIPAYKEGNLLRSTLMEAQEYLCSKDFGYEILVIVDGSPNKTDEVANDCVTEVKNLTVINNKANRGKGYIVRQGLLRAKGKYRLFMDADGSTSIDHLDAFLEELQKGYDVVIGSRRIQGALILVHQPKYREMMSVLGSILTGIVLGLRGYPDIHCGFKILNARASKEIASRMLVYRFGFDFELIILATKLGFRIKQMPVKWRNGKDSSLNLTGPNGFTRALIDLFKTKWCLVNDKYTIPK